MAKKYKIWIEIEEIDEDEDHYVNLDDEMMSVGEYDNLEEAREVKEGLRDQAIQWRLR